MTDLLQPSSVTYEITAIWPTGERTNYVSGEPLDFERAADFFETLAQELREVPETTT